MSYYNVPDDWGSYYYSCGCHASEGGCSCPTSIEDSERPWLEGSGYDWDGEERVWEKVVSCKYHTARKDHKDGRIRKGQSYRVRRIRYVEDESGNSWHYTEKVLMRSRTR